MSSVAPTLRCPACREQLRADADELRCAGCAATYETREGIPIFSEAGDTADLVEMAELVARLEARPDEAFPSLAHRFRLPTRRYDLGRARAEERSLRGFFFRFPRLAGLRILNVSCGVGREAQILLERGARELHLVDVSFPAVRYARRSFACFYPDRNLSFAVADAARLPYADGAFDLLLVYGSAHHYPNLDGFLSEAGRVARHVVLLAEPAHMGAAQWVLDRVGWNTEYGGLATRRLDESWLRERLEVHGFRCETERLFQYFPGRLDRFGESRLLVGGWFGLLRLLDLVTPRGVRHSLNAYGTRA